MHQTATIKDMLLWPLCWVIYKGTICSTGIIYKNTAVQIKNTRQSCSPSPLLQTSHEFPGIRNWVNKREMGKGFIKALIKALRPSVQVSDGWDNSADIWSFSHKECLVHQKHCNLMYNISLRFIKCLCHHRAFEKNNLIWFALSIHWV